ncbi:ABC transporter permease [Catellatospora coxensis]
MSAAPTRAAVTGRRAAGRRGRAAVTAAAGVPVRARHRDRHRRDDRRGRHLQLQPGRTGPAAGRPGHQPAHGRTGPDVGRQARAAAGRGDRPGRGGESVSAVGRLPGVHAYRNEHVHPAQTGSLTVYAGRLDLPETVGLSPLSGRWLSLPTADFPTAVLGWTAAQRLGIADTAARPQIVLGSHRFTVVGVLRPVPLAEDLDRAVFVGWSAATAYLGFDGHPTTVYTRTAEDAVVAVRKVLPAPCGRARRTRSWSRGRPTPWPPGRSPRTRSAVCCSAWARWRCWSAGSASPTRW